MFQGAYDYYSIFVIYFEREARSSDICPACNHSQARFLRPLINQQESRQVQVVMMGAVAEIMFFITLQCTYLSNASPTFPDEESSRNASAISFNAIFFLLTDNGLFYLTKACAA